MDFAEQVSQNKIFNLCYWYLNLSGGEGLEHKSGVPVDTNAIPRQECPYCNDGTWNDGTCPSCGSNGWGSPDKSRDKVSGADKEAR